MTIHKAGKLKKKMRMRMELQCSFSLHTNKRYSSEEEVEEGDDRMFDSPGVADRSRGLEAVKGVLRQPAPSCLVRHGGGVVVL